MEITKLQEHKTVKFKNKCEFNANIYNIIYF